MHGRWTRLGAAAAVAVVVSTGAVLATAGLAQGASAPIVIGSCATTVEGKPGTPVELSPSAVLSPVVNLLKPLDPLNLVTPTFEKAFSALPPIPIGSLPTGTGTISGGQIANDVVAQLRNLPLGGLLGALSSSVQSTLTSMCGVTVKGVNAAAAPVQQGTSSIASAARQAEQQAGLAPKQPAPGGSPGTTGSTGGGTTQQGGGSGGLPSPNSPVVGGLAPNLGGTGDTFGPGALLDFGLGESPLARYAGIPFASAGLFDPAPGVRYGGNVPGYGPGYGQLGQGSIPSDGVQTAGHAEALGGVGSTLVNGVGLPMLLAVLMLAGVTAALVRTWVLRRVRTA